VLEQSDEDSTATRATLKQFEELQRLHVEDRLRLQNELHPETDDLPTQSPSLVPGDPQAPPIAPSLPPIETLEQRIEEIKSDCREAAKPKPAEPIS
jgi:hypothetical protein